MAIIKGWSFGKEHGYTKSAESDGKVSVKAHERSCYATGGKVQKHYDRMENFRKEQDTMPAEPAKENKKMAKGGKWIAGAIKKPGALHKELGVPKGDKIPAKKLDAAAKKGGKEGQRARLAKTLKRMHKAEGGKVDLAENTKLGIMGGTGSSNLVAMKKGGKTHGKAGTAKKAAGALAQIAAAASQERPAMGAPPPGLPPIPQRPSLASVMPAGGPAGQPMRHGGHAKKR